MAFSQTRAKRGKSFSKVEDERLCIAWLCISEDPVIGVGQKDCNFWNRIFTNFMNDTSGEEQRTLCSLQNRWDKIRLCCNKYRGCLAQIQNRRQSGTTQADNMRFIFLFISYYYLLKISNSIYFSCIGYSG